MALWLISVLRVVRQAWLWIWWKLRIAADLVRDYARRFLPGWDKAFEILSTFTAEAAVLVIIFPPLEFLIASQNPSGGGARSIPMGQVLAWSLLMCLVFLLASFAFKGMAGFDQGAAKQED